MFFSVFGEIFKNFRYIFIAALVAFIAFSFSVTVSNWGFLLEVISSESATFLDKLNIFFSLFGSINTNFTRVSATYTVIIDILIGINAAMIIYYIRRRRESVKNTGVLVGMGGMASGLFGIGCAACGTFLLSSLFAIVGAGGLVGYLPFGGQEFGFLGVGLLSFSIHMTTKKIKEPLVCEIE